MTDVRAMLDSPVSPQATYNDTTVSCYCHIACSTKILQVCCSGERYFKIPRFGWWVVHERVGLSSLIEVGAPYKQGVSLTAP